MLYGALSTLGWLLLFPWAVYSGRRRGTSWSTLLGRCRAPRDLPRQERPAIWLHAVSAGEVAAAQALVLKMRREDPETPWVITTGTEAGLAAAKRFYPDIPAVLAPYDTPWAMHALVCRINPKALLLAEGDLWYGMICRVARRKVPIIVVSGKMSERSAQRWERFSWFSRQMMKLLRFVCVQDEQAMQRFVRAGVSPESILVTGNLKLAMPVKRLSHHELQQWRQRLNLSERDRVLLLGSTHEPEERLLLQALHPLIQEGWKVLLVPRHPARKEALQALLQELGLDSTQVMLLAEMGILVACMQLVNVTILGGSFVSGIGGHNVWEPVQVGCPVLFGPHHAAQVELAKQVQRVHGGECVEANGLVDAVRRWSSQRIQSEASQEVLDRTWTVLESMGLLRLS